MKQNLILFTLVCILISTTIFAQSKKKTSDTNTSHVGTWRLLSQKVTYPNGQIAIGDSSNIFQRKIITPNAFVIIIERKIPNYNNKRLATSVAGGHYAIANGNYEEFTQYASFQGFETMKITGKLSIEDSKLHLVAILSVSTGSTIYDELYVRED